MRQPSPSRLRLIWFPSQASLSFPILKGSSKSNTPHRHCTTPSPTPRQRSDAQSRPSWHEGGDLIGIDESSIEHSPTTCSLWHQRHLTAAVKVSDAGRPERERAPAPSVLLGGGRLAAREAKTLDTGFTIIAEDKGLSTCQATLPRLRCCS